MITYIYIPSSGQSTAALTSTYSITGAYDVTRLGVMSEAEFYYPIEIVKSGTTADYTSHRRTATISLSAGDFPVAGKIGNGVFITDSGDVNADKFYFYNPANTPLITAGFTTAHFVKTNQPGNGQTWIRNSGSESSSFNTFVAGCDNVGRATMTFFKENFVSNGPPSVVTYDVFTATCSSSYLTDNQWHHVAWVRDVPQQFMSCYIDGTNIQTFLLTNNTIQAGTAGHNNTLNQNYSYNTGYAQWSVNDLYWAFDALSETTSFGPVYSRYLDEIGLWSFPLSGASIAALTLQGGNPATGIGTAWFYQDYGNASAGLTTNLTNQNNNSAIMPPSNNAYLGWAYISFSQPISAETFNPSAGGNVQTTYNGSLTCFCESNANIGGYGTHVVNHTLWSADNRQCWFRLQGTPDPNNGTFSINISGGASGPFTIYGAPVSAANYYAFYNPILTGP